MIKVTYRVNNNTHTLKVVGHANYSEYGKDIVCAGVSSLVQALIGWLENSQYNEYANIDNGNVIVACESNNDVKTVFNMVTVGLGQIAKSYPDYVQIDISE